MKRRRVPKIRLVQGKAHTALDKPWQVFAAGADEAILRRARAGAGTDKPLTLFDAAMLHNELDRMLIDTLWKSAIAIAAATAEAERVGDVG